MYIFDKYCEYVFYIQDWYIKNLIGAITVGSFK